VTEPLPCRDPDSYDTVAADYAEFVKDPAELDALSRATLVSFAEVVQMGRPRARSQT
jgi:hypothetical protein